MRKQILSYGLFALVLWVSLAWTPSSSPSDTIPPKDSSEEVKWMSIEEAYAATQKNPKKIFIDIYTDWCGYCKLMDKDTFGNPDIAKYLNDNFYPVKFNAEQKEDIVLLNQTFKFVAQGRRGYHQLAAALMQGKMSYPTVVILNENFQMLQPIPGYRKPAEMKGILEFFAQNKHLKPKDNK